MKRMGMMLLLAVVCLKGRAEMTSGLCMIAVSQDGQRHGSSVDAADVVLKGRDCEEVRRGCDHSEDSDIAWTRWTGVSPALLSHEGASLDAVMHGEAGELSCSGTVHDGVLSGRYQFIASEVFAQTLRGMGLDDVSAGQQEGMLMLDINVDWVRQMKAAGVTGMSAGNVMGLRALGVDAEYVRSMSAVGYPEFNAGKLTSMKAVGVTPEKVKDAKAMGFEPSEEDLTQMAVFKIDRLFVDRMKAKGLKDLSLHQLIQIKLFKLDE